jgi:cation transport ATPase
VPAYQTMAQDSTSEDQSTDQSEYKLKADKFTKYEKKLEKELAKDKENKEKDVVDINLKFFWNLIIDIVTMLLIIFLIYYPKNRQAESIFSFIMFNLIIFMLTFVLNKVKISMGAAFGLFAVFSMLRYRTEGISIKDMTYLFIFIALGLISAIQLEYYELGIINGTIFIFTFLLDGNIFFREQSKRIEYENIEFIKPENYQLLMEDLRKRTGLKIHHFIIEEINFLNDSANIKIFYYDK